MHKQKPAIDTTIERKTLKEDNTIYILDDIDYKTEFIVIECLRYALELQQGHVFVVINSGGGDLRAATGIYNALGLAQAVGIKITGIVLSRAHSAACVILQACNNRIMLIGSSILMHWGSAEIDNRILEAIIKGNPKKALKTIKQSKLEMIKLLRRRAKCKEKKLKKLCNEGRRIFPDEALKLGLIDDVKWAHEIDLQSI